MASFVQFENIDPALDVVQAMEAFEDTPFLVLFESAARHRARDARYTFLTADPVAVTRLNTDQITPAAGLTAHPFAILREWQARLPVFSNDEDELLPPFCGGIAGLMSYELGHAFERIPRPVIDDFEIPPLLAGLFDWAIVWDHIAGTVRRYVLTLDSSEAKFDERTAWIEERLQRRIHRPAVRDAAELVEAKPWVLAQQFLD